MFLGIRIRNYIISKLRKKVIYTAIEIHKLLKKLPITKNLYKSKQLTIREGSEPYISGDTFRKIADVILESNSNLSNVVEKKVFWDRLELSFTEVKKISERIDKNQKLSLIIHNGDDEITDIEAEKLLEEYSTVFTTNYMGENSKVIPIPIGLENLYLNLHGDYSLIQSYGPKTESKILVNFNAETNRNVRYPILRECVEYPDVFQVRSFINPKKYFREISKYKFVLSPPGNGMDCHRTWEAIYCKTVPIVFKDSFPKRFADLPVLIIESVEELTNKTSIDLENMYQEISKKSSNKAYFKYWKEIIGAI